MRRWTLMLIVLLASALALVPAAAQETTTLADLLTASAQAETPEFTTLLAAVQAADPAVFEALSDPAARLTVFAPTDAAFAQLQAELGDEAYNALLADPAVLTDVLLYHVSPGAISYTDLSATVQALSELPFGRSLPLRVTLPTLQGQYLDVQAGFESLMIDQAALRSTNADIAASNGVVHTIDSVLQPETNAIGAIFTMVAGGQNAQFVTLTAALNAAGVMEALSDGTATPVTLFAPTDEAFAEAFAALGISAEEALADTDLLTSLLNYHLVEGVVSAADLGGATTADRAPAWLAGLSEDGSPLITTVNGATLTFGRGPQGEPQLNTATLLINDVDATNGLIHIIDTVLLPPSAE
jgi:uncharacterized surface protein with fasciclin (FAS1) repeats